MNKVWLTGLLTATASGVFSASTLAATEITWWHAMGGQLGETVNQLATDFNASQSDYKLTPVYKGSYTETLTAGIAAFRAGQAPNILQVFDAGAATIMSSKGVAKPVQDLMIESGYPFTAQDYIAGVRNFYADNTGKMVGMPFNSSTPVLYYNKDMLASVNAQAPQTYEQLEQVAAKLAEKGQAGFAQSLTPWIMFENFKSRHNLPLSDKQNGYQDLSTKIMFNSDDMLMHVKKLKEWSDKGYYKYYGSDWDANQTPFERGEVAMWMGSSGSFGGLRNRVKFNLGTTYLPYWESVTKNPTHTFIGGAALFVLQGHTPAQDKGVAAFFAYLTKPETQMSWHKTTGYVPVTNAAYDLTKQSGYYQENPDAEVGVKQLSLPEGEWTKGYRLGYYPQVREVMHREFDNIFSGRSTVESSLNKVEDESARLLNRFARTVQ
ncbi:sn-glycerol-3-phosphate ABC transporter substrate-binding protein UgpB [Vibrio cholerae]|uniref:sn-glycerol-3-phosphate ABC transporter substrate-binding protein UgpB n=1 Tax=Vibrio cholerae TaxID=666 RepID=UPI000218F3F0|nr:sn-glycerol-3-phosphate ABC transporter substrate-binding protein UgpB [Vibrio cholerae]EGR0286136.1 sn-glycerol-3-phosphate ABC transporter substrate-binding protein UgpB [Vibrio cholerae]EGR07253.1 bacterial extracellular solute-binding family protein [Vibrio cholerae HE48]EGR2511228.1 sn-glycerol-3-phosphate ABC transporter substrate-binding protein UgpB [Vibrio cholerae]EGR3626699.1 sn-glycerol-3-phosphate ABC transporter substrate-binding protein UgpB [Vibrio cholerae]EGR3851439.1 sn-g